MKKLMLTGLTAVMLSTGAFASEVTGYTDATANTPATAADINANFAALIAAINDNNSRIAALEAGGGASNDVTGKVFIFRDLGLIFGADALSANELNITAIDSDRSFDRTDGFSRAGYFQGQFEISFLSNGDYQLSGMDLDVEMFTNPDSVIATETNVVDETGTWSQLGSVITLTPPSSLEEPNPEPFDLFVSSAGDVLMVGEAGGGVLELVSGSIYRHEYEVNLGIGILKGSIPQ